MNRNQKIALGCGGAGCLGLILVVIVGVAVYFVVVRSRSSGRAVNFNVETATNRNSNSDVDRKGNLNTDSNATSSSSMSDDDRHKLYQAALMTGDQELIRRVSIKLGLMNQDFTPGVEYLTFVKDHFEWALRNDDFSRSLNTKEKALAYVNEHFED
jgi:hypothetical protein